LERIVSAVEALLETSPFEAIGVDAIARRAKCSTGSFYARFPSKDALLPFLYARYDAELRPRVVARMARVDWTSLTPRDACDRIAGEMVDMYAGRRHLMRAVALFARTTPPDAGVKQRREVLHDMPAALLAKIVSNRAPAGALARARTGLFIVAAAARDKILFGDAPHASATPMSNSHLKQELGRALYAYLTSD